MHAIMFYLSQIAIMSTSWRTDPKSRDIRGPFPHAVLLVSIDTFWRPFVKRFAYAIGPLSVCLSCLSVMLVYCVQTVGRIKMKLGMQVGLGPGHIVLGGVTADPLAILGAFLTLPGTKSSTSDSGSERS